MAVTNTWKGVGFEPSVHLNSATPLSFEGDVAVNLDPSDIVYPGTEQQLKQIENWMSLRFFEAIAGVEDPYFGFGFCVRVDQGYWVATYLFMHADVCCVWGADGPLTMNDQALGLPTGFGVGDTVGMGLARGEVYLVHRGDYVGSLKFEDPKTATPPENTHCDFPVGGEKPSPEAYSAMVAHKTPLPLPNFTFKNERQLYPVLRVKGYTVQLETKLSPPFSSNLALIRTEFFPDVTEAEVLYKRGFLFRHPPTARRALDCMISEGPLSEKRNKWLELSNSEKWAAVMPPKWAPETENVIRINLPPSLGLFQSGDGEGIRVSVTQQTRLLVQSGSVTGGRLIGRLDGQPNTFHWLHLRVGDPVVFESRWSGRPVAFVDQVTALEQGPLAPTSQ